MAYPTAPTNPIPTIATDTNFSAPGEDWDALPTKVAPTVAIETQGYVPGDARPADVDNYLFSTLSAWGDYASDFCDELKLQKVQGPASSTDNAVARFDSTTGKIVQNSALIVADTTGEATYATPISRTLDINFEHGHATFGTWAHGEGGVVYCTSEAGTYARDITEHLPDGASLTNLLLMVDPGAARAGGNRTNFVIADLQLVYGTPSLVATSYSSAFPDNAGGARQTITSGTVGYTISKSTGKRVFVILTSGTDGGPHNQDAFYGIRATYTDPGPSAR